MRYENRKIHLFFEVEASKFFEARKLEVQAIVASASLSQLTDEQAFCKDLSSKYRVEPLNLEFDKIYISAREEQIPGESHPRFDFLVEHMHGKTFPRQVITYHIPYSGTADLLRCTPNPRVLSAPEVTVGNNEIMFDIVDFYNDAGRVKSAADPILNVIRKQASNLDTNVTEYNNSLSGYIVGLIGSQREQVKGQSNVVEALGYPVKPLVTEAKKAISPPVAVAKPSHVVANVHSDPQWDVFICHASEDKEPFVRELAGALSKSVKVWYDDFTLEVGDSLRRSIDKGLARSRYGVVVLSHNFFKKEWPQKELDGLTVQERDGNKVILPVWLNIERDEIAGYSPMLADRMAVKASEGLNQAVSRLISVICPGT